MRIYYSAWLLCLFIATGARAQEDSLVTRHWEVNGYVKNLQTLLFFNDAYPDFQQFKLVDTFLQDNLLHNRVNFKWYPTDHLTFYAEFRNRVFWGDLVKSMPNYANQVANAGNDYFDLSWVLFDGNSFVIHSMLDRLYAEYVEGKWEVRVGRQRINWGINTVWNPNDIFNAFSFTDFDYEERPGSDALRVRYYTGVTSSIEVAARAFDRWEDATVAGLWRWNTKGYDFQALGGYNRGDICLGGGWAGPLGNWGWKGEFTYFIPTEETNDKAFAATTGLDYAFGNSLYVNAGYLYNSEGSTNASIAGLFSFDLSARNLYPYRHAVFAQASYPFTPLLNGGLAIIYSPIKSQALFANPTLSVSIKENWDLDMVGQLVFDKEEKEYKSLIQALFLRLKLSY